MTDRIKVHALDPAGATDGQIPKYDAASGRVGWATSSGGSTDPEIVRDTMAAALVAGTNVTITVDDPGDTITIAATGTTDPEVVRDTIAAALVAGSGVSITADDAANTITIAATGGGGGSAWTASVNDAMSSLAPFAAVVGTWAVSGGVVRSSTASGTPSKLRYNTKMPLQSFVVEVECNMISGSGDQRMGVVLGSNLTVSGASPVVFIVNDGSWHYVFDRFGTARDYDITGGSGAYSTWRKIRVAVEGQRRSMWIDGTFMGTAEQPTISPAQSDYVHLVTQNCVADFRNLKVWTQTLPA